MKKFRKAIAVLLAVLLCVSAVPVSVWAEAAQTTQEQIIQNESKTEQMEDEQFKNKTAVDKEDQEKDSGVNSDVGTERNENVQTEAVTDVKEDQKEKNINLKKAASFAGGDGSVEDPYQIATAEQLDAVRNDLSASYMLVNDIDLSGFESWEPIGEYSYNDETVQFRGNFNGNNYKISNLKIIHDNVNAGLFGSIYDTYNIQIKNIYIENANIEGNFKYAGVLCGVINRDFTNAESTVSIENCTASGEINGINTTMTGGLIGYAGQSKILNCKSYVNINGQGESVCVGGIIGGSDYQQAIQNCVNYGNISYESNGSMHIGGIAGNGYKVENSYNIGNLTAIQSEKANLSEFLFGGIQGGFGSFGPDGNVSNRYYSLKNCQNAAEEINAFQRKDNLELVSLDNIAFRIINSSVGERMIINNNISWSKTKINGNEVSADNPEVGPDKKHGKSVEASELDEAIRPEEPIENIQFNWKQDNFSFLNSGEDFFKMYISGNTKKYQLEDMYFNLLTEDMSNTVRERLKKGKNSRWIGSCYGMMHVAAIRKTDASRLPIKNISENAQTLFDLDKPKNSKKVENLVNYYYLMQLLPDNEEKKFIYRFEVDKGWQAAPEKKLEKIINDTKKIKNTPIQLDINVEKKNKDDGTSTYEEGHAILIIGLDETVVDNNYYHLKIYDPNYSDEQRMLIAKDFSEFKYKKYDVISDEYTSIDEIDLRNMFNTSLDQRKLKNYSQKFLEWNKIKNLDVLQNGKKISLDCISNIDGENGTYKGYLQGTDEKGPYTVVVNETGEYGIDAIFENFYLQSSSKNGNTIVFDPNGKVEITNKENENYTLSMTENNVLVGNFDTIKVKGKEAINSKLEKTTEGLLLTSDNLKNISIIGNNGEKEENVNISTDKEKVMIKGENEKLKVYIDKDNDAIYETLIAQSDSIPVSSINLNLAKTKLVIGEQLILTPTITPDNATEKAVNWSSSDNNIVTVDENGLVTAVAEGKATITVTTKDGNKTAACEVTVTKKEDPSKPEEPSNPTTPTVNPNDGQGTTTTGQLKPDTTNQGSNPLTGMTLQEKINTMIIWLAAAALCAAVVLFVKRKQKR